MPEWMFSPAAHCAAGFCNTFAIFWQCSRNVLARYLAICPEQEATASLELFEKNMGKADESNGFAAFKASDSIQFCFFACCGREKR
ncbi:hypothetical protein NE619_03120 [Anaerovorax odorimutans]|uniref:Uncharacterized protein n=1 Tax=Anaerovorax odorimutans TaxID=109327 RepID=A0ABT1RKK8_9FIRM|nr:hypothetical protein [Anaerovorax odorimutans]